MGTKKVQEHELVRMLAAGLQKKVIAQKLGVSRQTISRLSKKLDIQEYLNMYIKRQQEIEMDFLKRLEGIVISTLERILLFGNNSDKLKAIELYWRRRGEITARVNISGEIDVNNKTTEELEEDIENLRKKLCELLEKEYEPSLN